MLVTLVTVTTDAEPVLELELLLLEEEADDK